MSILSAMGLTQLILTKTYFMNILKIRSNIYLIILLTFSCSFTYGQGFVWNEEIEQQFINEVQELEVSRSVFPSSYSLERYLPKRMYQGGTSMCMAYSLAVARTILYAKNKNIRGTAQINDYAFSPFFSYILSMSAGDDDCSKGLNPLETLYHSKKFGMVMQNEVECSNYYPCTNERLSCSGYPGSFDADFGLASWYTIDNFKRLTKENQIKASISSKNPVIVGMGTVPFSFEIMGQMGKDWDPSWWNKKNIICKYQYETKKRCYGHIDHMTGYCSNHLPSDYQAAPGHAMVLVGYDDNKNGGSFLILNSWGSEKREWGSHGTIWVKYDDFFKYFVSAISIIKDREASVFTSKKNTSKTQSIPANLFKDVFTKEVVSSKETINSILPDLRRKD
jgi:hypothetical protein